MDTGRFLSDAFSSRRSRHSKNSRRKKDATGDDDWGFGGCSSPSTSAPMKARTACALRGSRTARFARTSFSHVSSLASRGLLVPLARLAWCWLPNRDGNRVENAPSRVCVRSASRRSPTTRGRLTASKSTRRKWARGVAELRVPAMRVGNDVALLTAVAFLAARNYPVVHHPFGFLVRRIVDAHARHPAARDGALGRSRCMRRQRRCRHAPPHRSGAR